MAIDSPDISKISTPKISDAKVFAPHVPDTAEQAASRADVKERRLNATVAATIAILANFMGVCKIKDDNIVQGVQ